GGAGLRWGLAQLLQRLVGGFLVLGAGGAPGDVTHAGGQRQEGQDRHAGQQGQQGHDGGRHAQSARIAGELGRQGLVGRAGDAGFGDQDTGSGGDDQRRNLGNQAIADGQQGVDIAGFLKGQSFLHHADQNAGRDVDEGD